MSLSISALILLIILFFITSLIGVVTGSNSLITVPVMFQFGIEPKVAVATNMFGLTFMSIGATIPFLKEGIYERKTLSPLIILTLIGSAIGAILVGLITNQSVKIIVSVSMISVVTFYTIPTQCRFGKGRKCFGKCNNFGLFFDIFTGNLRRFI